MNDPDIVDLKDLLPEELTALVEGLGHEPYRAGQLMSWVHARGTTDLDDMTDLSKSFREQLKQRVQVTGLRLTSTVSSNADCATKFLFQLRDGLHVESVLMREGSRVTACLSSQVGCPLGCTFCATAKMGFVRNLRAAEIVDQLIQMQRLALEQHGRVTNVVMMGMGEPLLNYDPLVRSLRIMRQEQGLAIGGRKTTVSTAGYVPGIRRLAREGLNVGLAISLNGTTDPLRSTIMPINRKFDIDQLVAAAGEYFDLTGRRVTFEYVLMEGLTDSDADAARLAGLSRRVPCKINLIPYNQFEPSDDYRRPTPDRIRLFRDILTGSTRVAVTIRESKGRDVLAACGQLYHQNQKAQGKTSNSEAAGCNSAAT